jgi:hypothetical protein
VGGDACGVWWREVSSATIGTNNSFIGNIVANDDIQLLTGATLNGRALAGADARDGALTLDANTITTPVCVVAPTAVPPTAVPGGAVPGERRPGVNLRGSISVSGLPNTGGAPIRDAQFPWVPVTVVGLGALAVVLGVRAYRRSHLPKR